MMSVVGFVDNFKFVKYYTVPLKWSPYVVPLQCYNVLSISYFGMNIFL